MENNDLKKIAKKLDILIDIFKLKVLQDDLNLRESGDRWGWEGKKLDKRLGSREELIDQIKELKTKIFSIENDE